MPYSKCPICGAISHLNVSDVQKWYAEYYPGIPLGELVPGKCFYCWPEIEVEMLVIVRQQLSGVEQVPVGSHGVVERVLSASDHGTIYQVRLESKEVHYFIRADLRKLREGEIQQTGLH